MHPIRTLLVDENADFLKAVHQLLSSDPDVAVVGQAQTSLEAVAEAVRLAPDLVLMSWTLPPLSGLQVLNLLKNQPNAPRVIILTVLHDLPCYREAALGAGADGLVCKAMVNEQLPALIRSVTHLPS